MPKLAANLTWMFHEIEFPDRFAAARELGFEAVECQFPYAWEPALLADRLAASAARQVMFNAPAGDMDAGEYGLACLAGREGEFQDTVAKALAYAASLECGMLHVLAGIVPQGRTREACLETFVRNLEWAARECENFGVRVLVEPINTVERPGYLITTTAEAVRAIELAGSGNLGLQFDFHNAQLMEGNLTATLKANLARIGHMQIAGVPGRTPPDRGELNYPYLIDLVDELGYSGWLGCEFRPGTPTRAGLAWAKPYGIG